MDNEAHASALRVAGEGAPSRREFVKLVFASGLLLGLDLPLARPAAAAPAAALGHVFEPNAFVRIGTDDWVTVIVKHAEMGQGTATGIATLVAEELDADWARVRVEFAPSDAKRYNNLAWGDAQGTGGSSAMRAGFEQMRKAGATARALLQRAAAVQFGVPAHEVAVAHGVLSHRSGKRARFGELALLAASQPMPASVELKQPSQFVLIGKQQLRRLDTRDKCTGQAIYTMDLKLPGLLTAVVARPPTLSSRLRSFDAAAARRVPGVTEVVAIPEGVAVVGQGMWAALSGRAALTVQWDESSSDRLSTEQLSASYRELAQRPGKVAIQSARTHAQLARAAKVVDALYELPFLAHATMEPMNCVAWLHDGELETWSGHQSQTVDHQLAAQAAGLALDRVKLHTLISGGSFGRRASPSADFVVEAVHIAKAVGGRAPVKLQRTREDDLRAGHYRPLYVHRVRVGLDQHAQLLAWDHTVVGQSILTGTQFGKYVQNGLDGSSLEGVFPTHYAIPDMTVQLHSPRLSVRPLWWRSVGHTHTAFVMETMMDELAVAAGQDPIAFRLALLEGKPRHRAVLELAARKADWTRPLAPGRARGLAIHESFGTVVAEIAEVSLRSDGLPKVERVVVALDCGLAINPDVIHAQMEGAIGFGLSAALHNEITIADGRVQQSNFHDYRSLRIDEMPRVEVHIVPSAEPPSGVGEPGTPPIAPAVANALYRLTGQRVRRLPFARSRAGRAERARPRA